MYVCYENGTRQLPSFKSLKPLNINLCILMTIYPVSASVSYLQYIVVSFMNVSYLGVKKLF